MGRLAGLRTPRLRGRAAYLPTLAALVAGTIFISFGVGHFAGHGSEVADFRRYEVPVASLAVWAVGETLGIVVTLQVLALYADLGIIRLSLGWPSAWWESLDLITDQVSDLFSYVTGL